MKNLQRKWLNVSDRDGSAFDPIRLQDRRRDSNVVAGVIGSGPNMRSNAVHDIKVFGVGGAGNNAINRMISEGVRGVTFVAVNCDAQDLEQSRADERIIIGERSTKRLGAGADPRLGEKAAIESLTSIEAAVADADMVFITAGMGGGTGSGAGPIVARAARAAGALTVGVVTTPFAFEQGVRMRVARTAVENMYQNVDSLVVISNDKLVELVPRSQPIADAFRIADEMLLNGVRGISDLITNCGFINVDFADVRKIMYDSGTAMLGVGSAAGGDRAESALKSALKSPLLETPVENATGILVNITAGPDLGIHEVNRIVDSVRQTSDPDADIVFGAVIDDEARDRLSVTVIATGSDQSRAPASPAAELPRRRADPPDLDAIHREFEKLGAELGDTQPVAVAEPTAGTYDDLDPWHDLDPEIPAFIRRRRNVRH